MLRPFTFTPVFSLLLCFILLINSNGEENTTSEYCGNLTCGNLVVKYPFWINSTAKNNLPQCGYQGLGLHCFPSGHDDNESRLHLQLGSDNFLAVKNISYTDQTVTLVDFEAIRNQTCPKAKPLSLSDSLLDYNRADLNLTFYFNCTRAPPPASNDSTPIYPIDCLRSGRNTSYVSRRPETNDIEEDSDWSRTCEDKVVAPVIDQEGRDYYDWGSSFGKAMNEGFVLDWRKDQKCFSCEASDGLCGFNQTNEKFCCFCNDGTIQPDQCNKTGGRRVPWKKIVIGICAAVGGALITCFLFLEYSRRQKNKKSGPKLLSRDISSDPSSVYDPEKGISSLGVHIFDYDELLEATNNFDSEQELGDGGFGTVYKGKLKDGRVVAVKRLYESNFKRVEHFINEVVILTRLRHRNLVTLYGCTSRHSRELLLVYEFIPNGTVADHLHGALASPGSLPWSTRLRIAVETATALSFLHASDVIHRDVKTNNLLLDADFRVKVADFGLSRLFPINATHISTAPQGTPGYVDPEYHQCYHLTDKSDVYSFGVVLIELISSLPAVDITRHRHDINLSTMAINKIRGNSLHELVDPNLGYESDYSVRMMINDVAELAFHTLQDGRDMRPSMQQVLETLIEIQNKNYTSGNANDQNENQADDVTLLKSRRPDSSPTSVIEGLVSSTTTSSTTTSN